jgi:hypothetical protein
MVPSQIPIQNNQNTMAKKIITLPPLFAILQRRCLVMDPVNDISSTVKQQIETAFPRIILPKKPIARCQSYLESGYIVLSHNAGA